MQAGYIFVLNNNTTVSTNVLGALVSAARENPNGAALSTLIMEFEEPDEIWHAGAFWTGHKTGFTQHLIGSSLEEQCFVGPYKTD